jgi:hypothetical protein
MLAAINGKPQIFLSNAPTRHRTLNPFVLKRRYFWEKATQFDEKVAA